LSLAVFLIKTIQKLVDIMHLINYLHVFFLSPSIYIYLQVYTLFAPSPQLPTPNPRFKAEPVPPSCSPILLKRKHRR
jgi:hypothetical protein